MLNSDEELIVSLSPVIAFIGSGVVFSVVETVLIPFVVEGSVATVIVDPV